MLSFPCPRCCQSSSQWLSNLSDVTRAEGVRLQCLLELCNQADPKGQPSFRGGSDKGVTGLLLALGVAALNCTVSVLHPRGKLEMEVPTVGGIAVGAYCSNPEQGIIPKAGCCSLSEAKEHACKQSCVKCRSL